MKLNVLLLEGIHAVAEQALVEAGHNVRRVAGALKEDDLIAQLEGVHLLGIRSKTNVTKKVLDAPQAKSLLSIGAFCIGTNQIALEHAMKKGICVFNAPFSNTRSVAELIIAEIVSLSRELGDFGNVGPVHTVQVATASLSEATPLRLGMNSCANTPV